MSTERPTKHDSIGKKALFNKELTFKRNCIKIDKIKNRENYEIYTTKAQSIGIFRIR